MLQCVVVVQVKNTYNMEQFFRALADRTRLRIINLIGDDEVCVCFLVEILKLSQPNISQHLAYLRRAGIIAARREGKWMHYRIIKPSNLHAASVLGEVRNWIAQDKEMQQDRKRLVKFCCSSDLPPALQGVPKPASLAL